MDRPVSSTRSSTSGSIHYRRTCPPNSTSAFQERLVCDEVTSALDPLVADGIPALLLEPQKAEDVAYLFITHDIVTVRAVADSIAVMHRCIDSRRMRSAGH